MSVEARSRRTNNGLRQHIGRSFDERYPEAYRKISRSRFEERLKLLGSMIEEISEADEEAAAVSNCPPSSPSDDGRSPYIIPAEDRLWPNTRRWQNFYCTNSPIRSRNESHSLNCRSQLEHSLTEPVARRRRYQCGLGERKCGSSFEHLPMDFLSLPPIPEAVPLEELCNGKASKYEEDGTDNDDSSECSDFNPSI
uniref:Uncharacterized protein n=1 Tax=Syphacia muris TaxID=451379 RepID=A0A0N5ARM2_9BILA